MLTTNEVAALNHMTRYKEAGRSVIPSVLAHAWNIPAKQMKIVFRSLKKLGYIDDNNHPLKTFDGSPYKPPETFYENIDGKLVKVTRCPPGFARGYATETVTAKGKNKLNPYGTF